MLKKIILWILVIACAGMIFFFSSQPAAESDKSSGNFIKAVISVLDVKKALTQEQIQSLCLKLNNIVRVFAHFSVFALLGFLISLLLNEYKVRKKRIVLYAVSLSILYAISDELHQVFVPGRSMQLEDICVDSAGAISGVLMAIILISAIKHLFKLKKG